MSRAERKTHAIKRVAKTWSSWQEVPVTDELRAKGMLKNVSHIYANSRFEIHLYQIPSSIGGTVQMVVARHGHIEPITWHDLLRIKNEIFGVECLAVEIYPREDVGEKFKARILWILPQGYELPFGLDKPTAWGG